MEKQYTVRKIDWDRVDAKGIPSDCIDIMHYFNKELKRGAYPLVPRTEPITIEEIFNQWIPNKDSTITYVAVDNDLQKVICTGTLFLNIEDKTSERLAVTKDLDYQIKGVGTDVTKAIIDDALSKDFTIMIHTSIDNHAMYRILEKLGYKPRSIIKNYHRYVGKVNGSADIFEYIIKPK